MKMMKKLLALVLALSSALSLATACVTPSESSSSSQPASSEAESTTSSSVPEEEETSEEAPDPDSPPETVWSEWEAVTQPTCLSDGRKVHYDINNPSITEYGQIEARGHDYTGENSTCIRCQATAIDVSLFDSNHEFPLVEPCTHTDEQIYEGQCDCAYKGRGEEYSRLQLSEGFYTVETVNNGEVVDAIWLSFSVQEAGQYMLYSVDNNNKVTAARYDASAHYVTPVPHYATIKADNFFSVASCTEQHFNAEWRATFCLEAEAGTAVKIGFVKFAEPAWERKNVYVPTYPTEINGTKAPEAPANSKAVEVDYKSKYYYADPATGGDGYYHLQGTNEIIYAAIDTNPSRLLANGKFTTIHYEGAALNLQDGMTAEGNYRVRSYVPFIMNCADDNDIFNEELLPDLTKNCYQNYCNSDGMYPVNKELFAFLNLYVKSTKPIDNAITLKDWQDQKDWLWLSACYTYQEIPVGTKENPLSLEVGENTVNLPLYDYLYCNVKTDGVYTIACDVEKVTLSLGKNTTVTAPFAISIENVASSPVVFTLSTTDGSAVTATVTVTETVGANNGLGARGEAFVIESLGDLTLQTLTVYGANESVSYYAYYVYTATQDGTLCLTVNGDTQASVLLGDVYANEGGATLEVVAGDTVIVYVSNDDAPASATVTLVYEK